MTKHQYAILAGLFLAASLFALDGGNIPLTDRPAWIKPVQLDISSGIDRSLVDSGFYYILNDQQMRVSPCEHYRHFAFKVINHAGLEEASRLEISYEPAFEKLSLHSFRVYRDGAAIDYRNRVRWRELQREDSLDNGQYDESRTMLLILEDIREGDIVEYDYSTRGSNPIFGSMFYGTFSHGLDYPMATLSFRLVIPPKRDIRTRQYVRTLAESSAPTSDGGKEIHWTEHNSPAVKTEEQSPDWYDVWPWIEMSEWKDWNQVGEWGRSVFAAADVPSTELKKTYDRLIESETRPVSREAALKDVLRFVQDQIRYFGIEIGVNSHKPHSPDEVLKNRFGDCKDKALLFCEMARQAGWEAWPVLVNSTSGRMVGDWLPSPRAFNHVIAAVRGKDGWIWFDPTISYQGGTALQVWVPDYGQVLMLDPSSVGLRAMPAETAGGIDVRENYTSRGFDGAGKLEVKTTYTGHEADRMRYRLASTGRVNIEKTYLEFYQSTFPKASKIDDVTSKDERDRNVIEVFETYDLPDMWSRPEDEPAKPRTLHVYPYAFSERFNDFTNLPAGRTAPLAITYPFRATHHISVSLPVEMDIKDDEYTSKNDWYGLSYTAQKDGLTVNLDYSYEPHLDAVPAADFTAFRAKLESDRTSYIGYTLSEPVAETGTAGKTNNPEGWLIGLGLGVGLWLLIITAILAYIIGFYRGELRGRASAQIKSGPAPQSTPETSGSTEG